MAFQHRTKRSGDPSSCPSNNPAGAQLLRRTRPTHRWRGLVSRRHCVSRCEWRKSKNHLKSDLSDQSIRTETHPEKCDWNRISNHLWMLPGSHVFFPPSLTGKSQPVLMAAEKRGSETHRGRFGVPDGWSWLTGTERECVWVWALRQHTKKITGVCVSDVCVYMWGMTSTSAVVWKSYCISVCMKEVSKKREKKWNSTERRKKKIQKREWKSRRKHWPNEFLHCENNKVLPSK